MYAVTFIPKACVSLVVLPTEAYPLWRYPLWDDPLQDSSAPRETLKSPVSHQPHGKYVSQYMSKDIVKAPRWLNGR